MSTESKKEKIKNIRVSYEIANFLAVKAKEQHCTESDIIREALNDYLFRDINNANLLLASNQGLKLAMDKVDRKTELLTRLFLFWLKYFFTYAPQLPERREEKVAQIKIGEARKKGMLEDFKKDLQENPSLIEQLVMDFFEFENTEGGTL
jgi:hypothetical protein